MSVGATDTVAVAQPLDITARAIGAVVLGASYAALWASWRSGTSDRVSSS